MVGTQEVTVLHRSGSPPEDAAATYNLTGSVEMQDVSSGS